MKKKRSTGTRRRIKPSPPQATPLVAVAAPTQPAASWAATSGGWLLTILGLLELTHWYPAGTFGSPYVSALALALGIWALFLGLRVLGTSSRTGRDAHFVERIAVLALLAFGFKNGLAGGDRIQFACVVLASLFWVHLNLPSSEMRSEDDSQPVWVGVLIAVVVSLGTWLRFHHLMDVPFGLNTDEVFNCQQYPVYLANGWHLFLTFGGHSMVAVHSIAIVFFHLLNMFGLRGVYALRFSSSAWGVLGMLSFYLFIRELLGWRAAMWGLAFLCISSFSILVSREDVCDPAGIAMLGFVFYFFWKGLKGPSAWFVPCGLVTGLYLHGAYWTHFVLPVVILLFLLLSLASGKISRGRLAALLALFLASFGLVYLNMVHYYFGDPHTFLMARANQAKAGDLSGFVPIYNIVTSNFFKYVRFYVSPEMGNALIYNPGKPVIDPYTAWLLLLGSLGAVASWKERRMETLFLLLYFVLILIPGSAAEYAPTVHRMSNQIPVLFALVGLGADRLQRLPGNRHAAWWSWGTGLLLALLLINSAVWNYKSFFQDFRDNYACREFWGGNLGQVGEILRNAPKDAELVVSDAYDKDYRSNLIPYEAGKDFRWSDTTLATLFPVTPTAGYGAVVVQEPSLELASGIFAYFYPHAVLHQIPDLSQGATVRFRENSPEGGKDLLCYYEIPAADVDSARGLHVQCEASPTGTDGVGLSLGSGFKLDGCPGLAWQGALWVPRTQTYDFRASLPPGMSLSLNGKALAANQPLRLGKGYYPFGAVSKSGASPAQDSVILVGQDGLSIDLTQPGAFRAARFAQGLRARYFNTAVGTPLPGLPRIFTAASLEKFLGSRELLAMSRIEPTVFGRFTVFNMSRTMEVPAYCDVIWDGNMTLPDAGVFSFFDENGFPLDIWVDGNRCEPTASLSLAGGKHALYVHRRLVWEASGYVNPVTMMVSCNGARAELLPMQWLRPD